MMFTFLAAIIISFLCMMSIDARLKLAFFNDRRRTLITLAAAVSIFILWDIAGIALGVFLFGNSPFTTGIMLAPHFPLEEIFFLTFLCYFSLVLFRLLETTWRRM